MKIIRSLAIGCAVVGFYLFFSAQKQQPGTHRAPLINSHPLHKIERGVASNSENGISRRKNTILTQLKPDATESENKALQTLTQEFDLKLERKLLDGKIVRLQIGKPDADNQEERVARLLMETGAVNFAEPDYEIPPSFIPSDSYFAQQWHHPKIGSESAWDITQGSSSVFVAICDGGFDVTHPDLADRFQLPGYHTVKNLNLVENTNEHGTITSGALAATGNNGYGVAGVAWKIKILPIQISDRADGSSTYSDVIECITYAKNFGVKVISISYDYLYASSAVSEAALAVKNAGGLVIVAAGNSGADISSWGPSANLIVAGATDRNDNRSSFSNYGTPVDLFAPGEDILTTFPGNRYLATGGTSMSAPLVAGTAALLFSAQPSLTSSQAENLLLENSTLIANLRRLNAGASVLAAIPPASITLDNLGPNLSDASRVSVGKWCSVAKSGTYGIASLNSCGSTADVYKFIPTIAQTKSYRISIRYIAGNLLSKKVPVKIKHAGGTTIKSVNMRSGGSTWFLLGTYTLNAGTTSSVEISASTGKANVDGIRFE